MGNSVKIRITEGVAHIALAQPPTNPLRPELRADLAAALSQAEADPEVTAIVLSGEGNGLSAGSDLRELDTAPDVPGVAALCRRIEDGPKPVVAALHGTTIGSGAELALAAHVRLMEPDARLSLPEISLGLVPGAGATQRLPRLVGAALALDMLLEPRVLSGHAAREAGLVDGVVVGHLATGAHTLARALGAGAREWQPVRTRRDRLADSAGYFAAIAARREALAGHRIHAAGRIVDCVEAALLLPFDSGLAFEEAARQDCLADSQHVALRHLYLAERRVPARLLSSTTGRRTISEPAGTEVLARLRHVLGGAVQALAAQGHGADEIGNAMTVYGFSQRPEAPVAATAGPDDEMILRRLIAALMAEGGRLVEDRLVDRASDVDVLAVHGLGFPRWHGGPMRAAQTMGLLKLKRQMETWAEDSAIWAPPRLLVQAIKFAGGFDQVVVVPSAA
ncbi:3-hydroxyacyl-CoA dehydrogenase [Oceanicola granulosus HTCC2516]|uniref:3-hydroxyacyl-CoA dehydrogenase n=1 Tax=Oceanicola granulosus (strain ATCC BAA-861 / DSM 15982 / KCTC 12143 / HTCC2516) TaxID=314256 RepID=Q2CBY7_OCEGH|nr:enoyl-CoA hydratase/isomerase family protein [Oceanicola granulosus]EAR50207.1 3-hydroxyacyl-CoA dehydrogenase [Oceanicola granulosus HTCC2516]